MRKTSWTHYSDRIPDEDLSFLLSRVEAATTFTLTPFLDEGGGEWLCLLTANNRMIAMTQSTDDFLWDVDRLRDSWGYLVCSTAGGWN